MIEIYGVSAANYERMMAKTAEAPFGLRSPIWPRFSA
jgi:hypothetical protein